MPFSLSMFKLLQTLDPRLRDVLMAILEEIERQREESVTKKEFNELKEIVKELAEAQKKTEQRLNELAEAQKKTEQRLNELAEAQKKTEQRLNELAEAQKKTEQELKKLVGEHRKTREQLGGLAHTVGYVLEDRAYKGLPPLLQRDFGVQVVNSLRRDYVEIGPNRYVEVNILGKAQRDGQQIWIVGECKTQLKKKDIDAFLKNLKRIKELLSGEILPVVVTYQASPPVRKYAEGHNLKLYFSYEFPI